MRKKISTIICCIGLVSTIFSNTYYIHPEKGNDANSGVEKTQAWKSFKNISSIYFEAGDIVSIAAGYEINGSLILNNISGLEKKPIIICSYKSDSNKSKYATINAKGFSNGILLIDSKHIKIKDIIIHANGGNYNTNADKKAMRCGILIKTNTITTSENIHINNVYILDIFYENEGYERPLSDRHTAVGNLNYGYGIRFINIIKGALIKNVSIRNSTIHNVAHTAIKFTGNQKSAFQDIEISNNKITKSGGPGIQMSNTKNAHVFNNTIDQSGSSDDARKWGRGSGMWTWGCQYFIIEKNQFLNASGPADSAGVHIDFNCSDIIVQYNFSKNNAGGFCEILGNNYNCSYRYNVSVNDGYRVKKQNGAFQDGKLFWLSGFVGKGKKRNGPFNSYFYNNTIYVKNKIVAKYAVAKQSQGILIVNNIFHILGDSKNVLGDQYQPELKENINEINRIVFKNNLFLNTSNWPKEVLISDKSPVFGNAEFAKPNGENLKDYIPTNIKLIKNKGIPIPKIPRDSIGLKIGLKVKYDILGNRIKGLPDMGAIEIK